MKGGETSQSSSKSIITEDGLSKYQQPKAHTLSVSPPRAHTPKAPAPRAPQRPSSAPAQRPSSAPRAPQRPSSAPTPRPSSAPRAPQRPSSAPAQRPSSAPRIPLRASRASSASASRVSSASASRASSAPTPRPSSAPAPRATPRISLRAQRPSSAPAPRATPRISLRSQRPSLKPYKIPNTLIPKIKEILIYPQQFKANTEFTYLSHRIYNREKGEMKDIKGVLITPNQPPSYITYNMLIREVGIFLEDEFYSEAELQEQYKKANENEREALKVRLWKIWYNIIAGDDNEDSDNNPPYKKNKLKRLSDLKEKSIFELEEESIFELDEESKGGRRRNDGKSTKSTKSTKGGRKRKGTKRGGYPTAEEKAAADAAAAAEDAYNKFLERTRKNYVENADDDQTKRDKYGFTERDKEIAYFDFAIGKDIVRNSYDIKLGLIKRLVAQDVKVHDIVCEYPQQDFPYPDKKGFNTLFRPNKDLFLYGMQLPHQFNRDLLLKSMIYIFHKKIYNIADLQGCTDAINRHNPRMGMGVGCNPYDRDCEPRMWERARFITLEQKPETKCVNIDATDKLTQDEIDNYQLQTEELEYLDGGTYYDIKIKDMTAGSLSSWIEISTIKDVSESKNSLVVHCLAGAGRTGSVLLYLLMRDSGNILKNDAEKEGYITKIKGRLAMPHFGLNNIAEVIGVLRTYFVNKSRSVKFATRELFKLGSRIMDKQTEDMLRGKGVDDKQIKKILEQGIDTDMYEYLMSKIDETELSELDDRQNKSQATSSLLRQRLNRIFFFLAKEFEVSTFYTYGRPTTQVLMLPNDEFSNPVVRVVSDWKNYNKDVVRKWLN